MAQAKKASRYLSSFTYEDTPVWNFLVNGVEICKEAGMAQGANTAALSYRINNRSGRSCRLEITPFPVCSQREADMEKDAEAEPDGHKAGKRRPDPLLPHKMPSSWRLMRRNAIVTAMMPATAEGKQAAPLANHVLTLDVAAGETGTLEIIYEMEPGTQSAQEIISGLKAYRKNWRKNAA